MRVLKCLSFLLGFALYCGLLATSVNAQSIVNRIDTFDEGIFNLSTAGTTSNVDSISTISSDLFDQREADVQVNSGGGFANASLDSFATPTIFINSSGGDFLARYRMADSSLVDMTAGGATGMMVEFEEFEAGEEIVFFATSIFPGGGSSIGQQASVTITGSQTYIDFSTLGSVDFTRIDNVGYAVRDNGGPSANYAAVGFYTVSTVPEPSTGIMLGAFSLVGLVGVRRRHR